MGRRTTHPLLLFVVLSYKIKQDLSAGFISSNPDDALLWVPGGQRGSPVYRVPADLYNIWKGIQQFDINDEGMVILLPCSYQQLMAAILAQSTPPLLCACADAHDLVFVNMDVNITIHVILESAKDTVNKVLKQNNVEQIIYMSNTDRIDFGEEVMMLGSECGGFQHIITKHPTDIVTIVVDCEDYSIPQLLGDFTHGPALMDALVNAIFVASPNLKKVEDRAIPANVVSIAFLPVCNECQMMISHDVLNGNSTEGNVELDCGEARTCIQPGRESNRTTKGNGKCNRSVVYPWYNHLRKCRRNAIANLRFNPTFHGFNGRLFNIGALEYAPYVIITKEGNTKSYSGLCLELIDILSRVMDFRYNLSDLGDNFGYSDENGTWYGSIRKVMDREVDMVLTGLTISSEREQVVDFTYPFWEERLGMITLTQPPDQFYLFRPFSGHVWLIYVTIAVAVAILVKSLEGITLYMCHGLRLARTVLGETLLFSWGAMWNIGHDYAPTSGPARLVVASFWVCVIVLVASYNAKLFSFLAMKERKMPFTTLEGALKAKDVGFYVVRTQVGRSLFEEAEGGVFAEVWSRMSRDPEKYLIDDMVAALVNMFETGVPAVLFDDHTGLHIEVKKTGYCNWGILHDSFLPLGFGIAFHQGSQFKQHFDDVMIRLHESGIIAYLKRKYFGFLEETQCSPDFQVGTSKLSLWDVWPPFAVAAVGLGFATVAIVTELLHVKAHHRTRASKRTAEKEQDK